MKRFISSVLACGLLVAGSAWAASDEIQVYVDDMNEVGKYGVELHLNYVPQGSKAMDYAGAIPSNHRFQATTEFSYAFSKSWEGGLYVPTAIANDGSAYANGLRLRMKYVQEQTEGSRVFWGFNTEFGYTARRVTNSMWGMELRPILGLRSEGWMLAINPIIDVPLSKGGLREAAFEPSIKVMREVAHGVDIGIEHYSSFGPIRHLEGWSRQEHSIYAVTDIQAHGLDINFGVGHGYHNAEDDWVVKAIISLPFN